MSSRLPTLAREELDPEAQRTYDEILAARGSIAGPFRVWLHSPEFTRRATQLGEFLRYHTSLSPRRSELVILLTARATQSPVEWAIHEPLARRGGLEPEIIAALERDEDPVFPDPADAALYAYCRQLLTRHTADEETTRSLVAAFGPRAAVEVTGLCGYYTMVSMTLNAFAIEA